MLINSFNVSYKKVVLVPDMYPDNKSKIEAIWLLEYLD